MPSSDLLSPPDEPHARVALFASSQDYHTVLADRLQVLSRRIAETMKAQCSVCVDTVPIPERRLAVLAGVAWLGRNCCAFTQDAGSFCVLGEVVTDLEPPGAAPQMPSLCGDCRHCVDACPTAALGGDGTLDATRCLSALTQKSGGIPTELGPLLGDRLYGCDVCQEVCPHNASVFHSEPAFAVRSPLGRYPLVVPLLELSAQQFRESLYESPVGWLGRTRVRRSACVVAGNVRAQEAIPALLELAAGQSSTLQEHAQWALRAIAARNR